MKYSVFPTLKRGGSPAKVKPNTFLLVTYDGYIGERLGEFGDPYPP